MTKKLPQRDPIAAYARKEKAQRRVGVDKQCKCGENRPEAIISGKEPVMCAQCQRRRQGQSEYDNHHVAGKANAPETVSVPVNDHRAELSVAQQDWPRSTLENPTGSPLLRIAASVRGFVDTIMYLLKTFLHWIPEALEELDSSLVSYFGQRWWDGFYLPVS